MLRLVIGVLTSLAFATNGFASVPANSTPPFTHSLSNISPLVFGMTAADAEQALGSPLNYLKGRPGNETFLVIRSIGGSGLFPRGDRLYLQFRRGRLTGFKGDWGQNWMWR